MISRSQSLARFLLHAMGLGAASAALLGAGACGGKVVVDPDGSGGGGEGGGGSTTGATSGATSSSSTGGFSCGVPAGQEPVYACLTTPQGEGCPPFDSALVFDDLAAQLNEIGCGGLQVQSIVCGPDPAGKGCCYVAAVMSLECGGRPFVVDGVARTAPLRERADWCEASWPELSGLDKATRNALAAGWAKDAQDEHASVASFARFVLELLAVGAPAELTAAAQRAMGDEIRHAELCFGLATAYGGISVGPGSFPVQAPEPRASIVDVAAAVVREGCIGETLAAFCARVACESAADPAARSVLATIAEDEAEHAALAWRFVAWALGAASGPARVAIAAAVREAFDEALACPLEPAGKAPDVPDRASGSSRLRHHGRLSASERRAALAEGLHGVVRPCARALLDALAAGELRDVVTPAAPARARSA